MEFFVPTYGSYNDLVYAVGVITRIIQSPEFNGLLGITFIMSAFIGLMYSAFSALYRGGKVNVNWGFHIVLGFLFVFALIKPTATVIIEDKYYGASGTAGYFTTINDVPFGAALMVWFYSYTQNIVTKMIDDYGAPVVSIADGGTDISYKLITQMDGIIGVARTTSPKFVENLRHYMHDCVTVGVAQELIDIEKISRPGDSSNVWAEMKLSSSGDLITTVNNGSIMSCNAAHTAISAAYTTEFTKIMNNYCEQNGVNGSACEQKLDKISRGYFNKSAKDFVMTYLASMTAKNVAESYLELADKQTNIANATAAIQAEKWLPKLRSNTFVVVVLLAPLVFLLVFFAPGAVIKWYGGMFVWLVLWGGVDQLMFVMYQKELYDVFQSMRSGGMGFLQVLDVKHEMLESMGLYGKMRWVSMTLSLAMCMGILKIGNHAMVGIAESMGASAQQTAGASASALSGVGGTAAAEDALTRQQARGWAASMTNMQAVANQELLGYHHGVASAQAKIDQLGGNALAAGNRSGIAEGVGAAASVYSTEAKIKDSGGAGAYIGEMANMELANFQQTMGTQAGMQERAAFLGGDLQALAEYERRGALNAEQAAHLQEQGFAVKAGDQIQFGLDGGGNASNFTISRNTDNGQWSAVYSNDGSLAYTKETGSFAQGEGSRMYDSNGKLINESFTSGSSKTVLDVDKSVTDKTTTVNTGWTTTHSETSSITTGSTVNYVGGTTFSDALITDDISGKDRTVGSSILVQASKAATTEEQMAILAPYINAKSSNIAANHVSYSSSERTTAEAHVSGEFEAGAGGFSVKAGGGLSFSGDVASATNQLNPIQMSFALEAINAGKQAPIADRFSEVASAYNMQLNPEQLEIMRTMENAHYGKKGIDGFFEKTDMLISPDKTALQSIAGAADDITDKIPMPGRKK